MHIKGKSVQDYYQLFYGICDNRLFLQIFDRQGKEKYAFEGSKDLDISTQRNLLISIMESADEFFCPPFKFDEDFILGNGYPFLIRREGEKVVENAIVKCTSFDGLPAFNSTLYIESYLPFEEPLQKQQETNLPFLESLFPQWMTVNTFLNHGIAE